MDLGIDLRREKEDEELEDVDAEAVRHDVVPLHEVHAEGEHEGDEGEPDPTVDHERSRLVEQVLVPPRRGEGPLGHGGCCAKNNSDNTH